MVKTIEKAKKIDNICHILLRYWTLALYLKNIATLGNLVSNWNLSIIYSE